jgi:hypothetical protein
MVFSRRAEEPMSKTSIFGKVFLIMVVGGMLTVAGGLGGSPLAFAANPTPDKDYLAVFPRGSTEQPFAMIEKPKGVPIGDGSNVEIDAFALRVTTIDPAHAKAFLQGLPALDAGEGQMVPPGFRLYGDKRYVEASYAAASQRYKITFTDPADVAGRGGGGENGAGGGGSGGGGSM